MKLFKRHYQAIEKRGQITEESTINDFIDKFNEESNEMLFEKEKLFNKLRNNFIQEVIDTIMVLINMLQFLGVNIEDEFKKNTEHQEARKD